MAGRALLPAPAFTYASDEVGRFSQQIIKGIERISGQPRIRRLYDDYKRLDRPAELFWGDAVAALRLDVAPGGRPFSSLPATGPQMVVANHPFGVVDGVILCWLVSQVRDDFKIMTHSILYQAPEIRRYVIPVDFSGTREALANNLRSRREARRVLATGGVLILFPAGGVAISRGFRGPAVDLPWGTFAAKLLLKTEADVLPVHFSGQNSRLYQIAANIHLTLKLALLFHEVRNKIGRRISLAVGDLIPNGRLRAMGDRRLVTDFLRESTLALQPGGASPWPAEC